MRNDLTFSFGAQVERGDLIAKREEKRGEVIVINFYIGFIGWIFQEGDGKIYTVKEREEMIKQMMVYFMSAYSLVWSQYIGRLLRSLQIRPTISRKLKLYLNPVFDL